MRNIAMSRRRSRSLARAATEVVEPLERRRLLSTINWTNKGTGAGAGDTDDFNATYGANATLARAITQRAIDDWERVIVNFNYSGGGNTYSLQVFGTTWNDGLRGQTDWPATNAQEKPTSTRIQMDNDGGGSGWWFDPDVGTATVPDDAEFTNAVTPFAADSPGLTDRDFYRTIVHEIGHAMGILRRGNGDYAIESFMAFAGTDPVDTSESLYTINVGGGAAEWTMTSSGGGHLFEGGGTYAGPTHPNEGMNAGRAIPITRRNLISDTAAAVLRDCYGYTIALPSTLNTFYVNLDTVSNVVTVNGDIGGGASDIIDLETSGASTRFEVNGTTETIAGAQFTTININTGDLNDDVDLDGLLSAKTVNINLGAGNDRLDVAPEFGDIDTDLLSNASVNAGTGDDTITFYDFNDEAVTNVFEITSTSVSKDPTGVDRTITHSLAEQIVINGSAFADTFNVLGIASADLVTINGADGNDTINVGGGDYDTNVLGDIVVNGAAGTDRLVIDDLDDTLNDAYTINSTSFSKSSSSAVVSFAGALFGTVTIDAFVLNASAGNSLIDVNSTGGSTLVLPPATPIVTPVGVTVNAGDGDDTIQVTNSSDFLTAIRGNIVLTGGVGIDSIVFNDNADTSPDAYTLTATTLTASDWDFTATYSADRLVLNAGTGNDTVNTTSGGFWTYNGGAGADEFNVQSGLNHVIHGQAGLDEIAINQDETSLARVTLDQSEDLQSLALFEGSSLLLPENLGVVVNTQEMGFIRGTIDLKDNMIVVRNRDSSYANSYLFDKIHRGYNNGTWNGTPAGGAAGVILSTTASATAANDAIGYVRIGAAAIELNAAVVGGVAVAAGDVVIRYTLAGDTNLDQAVNFDDLLSLAQGYSAPGNWRQGDNNYTQTVTFDDLLTVAQNYGGTISLRTTSAASALATAKRRNVIDSM